MGLPKLLLEVSRKSNLKEDSRRVFAGMWSERAAFFLFLETYTSTTFAMDLHRAPLNRPDQGNKIGTTIKDSVLIQHAFIHGAAEQHPQKIAVILVDQCLSYAEILEACESTALHLVQNGYVQNVGDIVCQCIERSIEMVSCFRLHPCLTNSLFLRYLKAVMYVLNLTGLFFDIYHVLRDENRWNLIRAMRFLINHNKIFENYHNIFRFVVRIVVLNTTCTCRQIRGKSSVYQ